MATIQDIFPYVMPSVQGCPTAIVKNALRHAINEFCEKTLIWRVAVAPIDIVEGQSTYTATVPVGTVLVAPVYVAMNNNILSPTNIEDLDQTCSGWRVSSANTPLMYFADNNAALQLVPTPSESTSGALSVEVALKMDLTSDSLPDWMFQNWVETLAHGALMRLHAMPGHVWTDTTTVAYHKSKFRDGISRAKSKTMKSFSRQSKTVQPRQFWQ